MKILIVTDAWDPQVNGVVKTLQATGRELEKQGHEVEYLTPSHSAFKTFPLPTYPEIRLVWNLWHVGKIISKIKPDAIHIATEGTLGMAARTFCYRKKLPITSSYHTKTPEYIKARLSWFPISWGYRFMRWLHRDSRSVLVTTESMKRELDAWSLHPNLTVWSRGTDLELFNPRLRQNNPENGSSRLLYVGRVSVEKNLEAFLDLNIPDTHKVIVGDGPDRERLETEYPDVQFLGYRSGEELAKCYADADVFVFPSKTDTFGIVMIEANACGTPVAAYPVTGPLDFVENDINGFLHEDLEMAVIECLEHSDRNRCRQFVEDHYSWATSAEIFEKALVPITDRWKFKK
jgi:glycosyltransferase involved in cell wall biosynthesis